MRVRRGTYGLFSRDLRCGGLRSGVEVMGSSLGGLSNTLPLNSFSLITYGPPCGVDKKKVAGPRGTGLITERRSRYALSSIYHYNSSLLRFKKQLYVYRHPRELTSTVRTVHGCSIRPGGLELIRRQGSGTPGLFLLRNEENNGEKFLRIVPALFVRSRDKGFSRRVLGVCNDCGRSCVG